MSNYDITNECQVCPTCKKEFYLKELRNKISLKEFTISGMCQKCQDSVFGKD